MLNSAKPDIPLCSPILRGSPLSALRRDRKGSCVHPPRAESLGWTKGSAEDSMLEGRGTLLYPPAAGFLLLRPIGDPVSSLVHRRAITSHLLKSLSSFAPLKRGALASLFCRETEALKVTYLLRCGAEI